MHDNDFLRGHITSQVRVPCMSGEFWHYGMGDFQTLRVNFWKLHLLSESKLTCEGYAIYIYTMYRNKQ